MFINHTFFKIYKTPLLLVFASMLFYFSFAYNLVRTDYIKLVTLYAALFFLFYKLVNIFKTNVKALTYFAFAFRTIFILAIPNLSQDFYRFIWDGRLILEGFNPYLYTVESFIKNGQFPVAQTQKLYQGMGNLNASHFTNYAPINQLCFAIAGLLTSKSILGSVMVMRFIIITADFGTLYFGKKLLSKLNLPAHHIFWYILNPFIIIELTGNLHFEGVMIFFLVWSLYLLHIGKWKFAAVVFALSISTKLIPLMFLPLFFKWFVKRYDTLIKVQGNQCNKITSLQSPCNKETKKWIPVLTGMKKLILFYVIIGIMTVLFFAPFYASELIENYLNTTSLWFKNFQFNASLFYIAKAIGYSHGGYNEIVKIGKTIPYLVILFVIIISFFRKNKTTIKLITAMLFVLSFYFFTATTVHPWYIATLLILSVFTKYRFPLVWSFIIILSYLSYINVNNADKSENLWIITFEYLIVYGVFIWEVFIKKAPKMEA